MNALFEIKKIFDEAINQAGKQDPTYPRYLQAEEDARDILCTLERLFEQSSARTHMESMSLAEVAAHNKAQLTIEKYKKKYGAI